MINRMNSTLVPKHQNLILQFPRELDIRLGRRLAFCIGDPKGLAGCCYLAVLGVLGDLWELRDAAHAVPGCVWS